jgi:hypothetical protein
MQLQPSNSMTDTSSPPKARPAKKKKPPKAKPSSAYHEEDDRQAAEEAALAQRFLQEAMCCTPRGSRPNMNAPTRPPEPLPQPRAQEDEEDEEDPDADDPRYSADPECLLARRRLKGTDVWSYLVRWKGLSEEWDCWVDAEHLDAEFVTRELEETESDRPLLTARAHADLSARAEAAVQAPRKPAECTDAECTDAFACT